jgi:aryl-alcohol dehydrogenase-like predicted oxidoreductase
VLTGKYAPGSAPPAESRAAGDGSGTMRFLRDEVLERVALLEPLAKQVDLSMAALAVAWVLQNSNVSSAIIGASRPEQVVDNVKAAGVRLDADLMAAIDDALLPVAVTDPGETAKNAPSERP